MAREGGLERGIGPDGKGQREGVVDGVVDGVDGDRYGRKWIEMECRRIWVGAWVCEKTFWMRKWGKQVRAYAEGAGVAGRLVVVKSVSVSGQKKERERDLLKRYPRVLFPQSCRRKASKKNTPRWDTGEPRQVGINNKVGVRWGDGEIKRYLYPSVVRLIYLKHAISVIHFDKAFRAARDFSTTTIHPLAPF